MRLFWKLYFFVRGWKITAPFPHEIKKAVIIVAPHTCSEDFLIGMAGRSILRIKHAHYLGKKELFDGPFGFIFRSTGGIPVDRFDKHNLVDQVVDQFNSHAEFLLALSPEGTRQKVERLRTGFYHIAKKAGVPIIMIGLDFAQKQISIAEPFLPSDNEAADFQKIHEYFVSIQGKYPEKGVSHLINQ